MLLCAVSSNRPRWRSNNIRSRGGGSGNNSSWNISALCVYPHISVVRKDSCCFHPVTVVIILFFVVLCAVYLSPQSLENVAS